MLRTKLKNKIERVVDSLLLTSSNEKLAVRESSTGVGNLFVLFVIRFS